MRPAAIALGMALFGLCWIAQVFILLGIVLKKQMCFSCAYIFFCFLLLFYFITFMPTYIVGHIMSDFCTVFPSVGESTANAEFVLKGQSGSISGMFTKCLMDPNGNILSAVNYNTSGAIDNLLDNSFNLASLMPSATLLAATNNSAINAYSTANAAMKTMATTALYDTTAASQTIHNEIKAAASSVETPLSLFKSSAVSMETTFSNFDAVQKAQIRTTITDVATKMSKCQSFSDGYKSLRDAWCDQLLVTWDATYFTQFALLVMMVVNMIVLTFFPKRYLSGQSAAVAPADQKKSNSKDAKKKPVQKEKVTKKK